MKLLRESKTKMPISVLTDFVSNNWSEISTLRGIIESCKHEFTDGSAIANTFQDLLDAYLICTGELERILSQKGVTTENITESIEVKEDTTVNIDDITVNVDKVKVKNIDDQVDTFDTNTLKDKDNSEVDHIKQDSETFEYCCDFEDPEDSEIDDIQAAKAWLAGK